jgi:threonine dehydrogenase-like Zn-dependent dehydrogenase
MKAVCWNGIHDVRVENVPDPTILNPHDCIVQTSLTAICGSDLHLYDGYIPAMMKGDILGHEFMGEVVEVGPEVQNLKIGDRVVVPFPIACGRCFFCQHGFWSSCDNTNPKAGLMEAVYGYTVAGIYGYSHLYGGYQGGQAQYVRVPFADVGPIKVPDSLTDEQVLFLSDIFPTGYFAADNCDIQPGDTIAVFGCGPVGQMAIRSAYLLGAERVIALDRFPDRLQMAEAGNAEAINYEGIDVVEQLKEMTGGRGPDACIDAVGMEAHGLGFDALFDRVEQMTRMETDRPTALRAAIQAVRQSGKVSIVGAYGGFIDKFPIGGVFNKGLTLKSGQAPVHKYMQPLLERIERGEIDPSFVITHRLSLDDASQGYHIFKHKLDHCVKVVLDPRA